MTFSGFGLYKSMVAADEVDKLTDDDLETIETIARNGQSGRITEREIKLLVAAYRERKE